MFNTTASLSHGRLISRFLTEHFILPNDAGHLSARHLSVYCAPPFAGRPSSPQPAVGHGCVLLVSLDRSGLVAYRRDVRPRWRLDHLTTNLGSCMTASVPLLRSSTCPHFGLLQRRATGSDGVARCPLLRWHCGAPPHLCLLWGHPTWNCARYATRDSRAARGPKYASSPAAA
ncbi:hypothetical protein Q4I32_002700 [Leishmania shawi]|uniref:Uncharacterized protein n=1 Tax=Leishmania shawi TaxID=5680 RepID=A0AAW3C2E2_9TRYP